MLETLGVLPLIQLFLEASLFDMPTQQVGEKMLTNFRLLLQIALLLDAKEALRLKLGSDQLLDKTVQSYSFSYHSEEDLRMHECLNGILVLLRHLCVIL